jgi:ATP adenylyltransferase/5',5'''-P-1,P-4-tetraphosphate phosphorylase II
MLTLDSYKRQHEELDLDDFKVMLEVLRRFPSMYVLFNCGEKGGCSRVHKHMQGLIGPPYAFDHIMADRKSSRPYVDYIKCFKQGFKRTSAADVFAVYTDYIKACRVSMNINEQETCPHNVVMWYDTLMVIPRRKGSHEGASANAGGMLGSVWVSSQEHVDEWWRVGSSRVLRELGLPNSESIVPN